MAQTGPEMHNCAKWEVTGKTNQGYLCQSIVLHHTKMFKKNKTKKIDRTWDIRLNNFVLNWAQIVLLLEKGTFWENWPILLLSTYCSPLRCNVSKKAVTVPQYCSFEANWTEITYLCSISLFFLCLNSIKLHLKLFRCYHYCC